MTDRIPTRVLDNNAIRYAVYSEGGVFQRFEYLLPADEPLDTGTPLNKGTLLSDDVAGSMSLSGPESVPDRAFNWIYKQFQTAFAPYDNIVTYTWSRVARTVSPTPGGFTLPIYQATSEGTENNVIWYADSYNTDHVAGTFTLVNGQQYTGAYTAQAMTNTLRGKYLIFQYEGSTETTTGTVMYYVDSTATFSIHYYSYSEPADSADAICDIGTTRRFHDTALSNLSSNSPDTYPNPSGWRANIYFTLISSVGGGEPKLTSITAGQYTGTGASGAANKTRITFSSSIPKVVIVAAETSADTAILLRPCTKAAVLGRSGTLTVTWGDDYVEWYSDTAPNQLNNNGTVYHYAGII